MINGTLEQFLDTGWYTECTLYYKGYLYWCEQTMNEEENKLVFFVDRWKAKNEDNVWFSTIVDESEHFIDEERIFEVIGSDLDDIKKDFYLHLYLKEKHSGK